VLKGGLSGFEANPVFGYKVKGEAELMKSFRILKKESQTNLEGKIKLSAVDTPVSLGVVTVIYKTGNVRITQQ
jgi:hypothetical protein